MTMSNVSFSEFSLVGFHNLQTFKPLFFNVLLVLYILTLTGNLLIVILVSTSQCLRSPMYFFLSHLSFCDILLPTIIVPKVLNNILTSRNTISFVGCFTQFYFFCGSLTTECLLLTMMSFDRYLAICNPLRYHSIMNLKLSFYLVISSCFISFSASLNITLLLSQLDFCSNNNIDHFFCDYAPVLELSCSVTTFLAVEGYLLSFLLSLCPFVFIVVTYTHIVLAVLRIPSTHGRHKAFSTCTSHLTVVSMYYGTLIIIYVFPSRGSLKHISKLLSLLYTVITPLFNPIIYSLRNQEIIDTLLKLIKPRQAGSAI